MADANLVDFVKQALERGETRPRIKDALKKAGWPEDQVDSALAAFADVDFPLPVPRPKSYGSAREAFLYIVYFSLLGLVAGQTGALAFAFIDRQFADELVDATYFYSYATTGLRWSVASLLVGFPIFLLLGARLAATKRKDPERRRSRVHAWLTYVTLIFAAGALIGDLVAVVFQFLNGEIGARFIAKAGVVGVISAAILWNYSRDVERHSSRIDFAGRILALAAILVVGALVVWAFTIVRSPKAARERIADEQRIENLGTIARLADCHYTYFRALPESLDAMGTALSDLASRQPVDSGCSEAVPYDPVTGAAYVYRAADADSYSLCATFEQGWADVDDEAQRDFTIATYGDARTRQRTLKKPMAAGETCFDIDAVAFETEVKPQADDAPEEPAPENETPEQ